MTNKKNLAVAFVLVFSVMAQVAGATSVSLSAGSGRERTITFLDANLLRDESLSSTSVASFGSGVRIDKSSSGLLKSGSGSLEEHHWAENSEGDYASTDANLTGSKSWSYRFSISTAQDKVSAGENLDVSSGTDIDFSAKSGNKNGDEAVVRVRGADDSTASMKYSNYAEATKSSASAKQTIEGLTTSGGPVGSGAPLVIEGWAGRSPVGDKSGKASDKAYNQYAAAWSSVLGGSSVSSSISVKSGLSSASASQKLRASKFEVIAADAEAGSGSLSASLPNDNCASVYSGAVNGNSFSSIIDASSTKDSAAASQAVNAKGELVFKGMLAGQRSYEDEDNGDIAGYETMASGHTEVASGNLASKDRAESSGTVAKVSEAFSAKGYIYREVDASTMWEGDPLWKIVRAETYTDKSLSGSSQASSQPEIARITGKWVATSGEYNPEAIFTAGNSTMGMVMEVMGDTVFPFGESITSTKDTFDIY